MRILLAAVAATAAAFAQNTAAPADLREVRDAVAAEVENGNTSSIAVAIWQAGRLAWAEGFGLANRETGKEATADTIYRLASISKPFTGTAIMQLVERGLVDLDAPANRYLDQKLRAYRGPAEAITVRRLLNHTSGLPTHWNFFYGDERPPPRAESIRAFGFAADEPGTRARYSNFAFGVLDHIIARVGKKGYRGWLKDELLDPLGMPHTDVGVRPGKEEHAAVGYRKDSDDWIAVEDYGFDHDGASAVHSSVNDLMRFCRLQLEGGTVDGTRLLDHKTVMAMREARAKALGGFGTGAGHGIAWQLGTERGEQVLRHSGGMPGVSTQLLIFPEHDTAIAVLTNSTDRGATNRGLSAILDHLFAAQKPLFGMGGGVAGKEPAPPKGRFGGQIAHPDGPLPLVLQFGEQTTMQVGAGQPTPCKLSWFNAERANVRGEQAMALGHGKATDASLTFELTRTENGLRGLLYATAERTCKLPFWVELTRAESKPKDTLRVISYNVLIGFGDSEVGRFLPGCQRQAKVAAWLAGQQPDVVALQEMNGYTEARLRRLAAVWGHPHVALLKEDGYPVAITSAAPLSNIRRVREGLHHGMLRATTHGTDFIVVHYRPHAGVDKKLVESRWALGLYGRAMLDRRPAVILGDFNCVARTDVGAFSPEALERYRKWQWTLEDGRPAEFALDMLLDTGAVDVLLHAGTPPAEWPLPRIDFILASPDLAARATSARWLCDDERLRWSDHPPVVADFARSTSAANRK